VPHGAHAHARVRSVPRGWAGFGLGGAFGFIMGGVNTNPALMNEDPTKLKFKDVMRATGRQSWSYAKSFAVVGAVYAGSECLIESVGEQSRPLAATGTAAQGP